MSSTSGKEDRVRTYYGQPVLKEPEWTYEVPWYLFVGGTAGVSSGVAALARLRGNQVLADRARMIAALGAGASPPLLIADLGRPKRFLHMLRVFKPTSAMSVGSWILAGYSSSAAGAEVLHLLGWFPRLQRALEAAAALLGPPMATYTGALLADSSIPVWHEARRELPFLFGASAVATAGAAATLITPPEHAAAARRLALAGAAAELAAGPVMKDRLGEVGEVYEEGVAGRYENAAKVCTAVGAALMALGGRRRRLATLAGSALLLAGGVCQRWAVYRAGFQSAWDPKYVVKPQRDRREAGKVTPFSSPTSGRNVG
ncbi:MAG: polysulfide reductase [Nitriliruptorales bacterium]|nr:polysulfide reductase [Nitriliruptorales bacterium]